MRHWIIALGCIAAGGPALGQSAPNTLIGGEMAAADGQPGCSVSAGYATYQRNFATPITVGAKAVISFPIAYCNGWNLRGQAVMTFNGSSSGAITFKRSQAPLAGPAQFAFTNYSETINGVAHEIVVRFNLVGAFPVTLDLETP